MTLFLLQRIYTDSEVYDPEILQQLLADHAQLKASIATFENPFPPTGEFVINVYREDKTQEELTADDKTERTEKLSSEYYCVDHATRLIFFLKEFRADWMEAWGEADGVRSAFQLRECHLRRENGLIVSVSYYALLTVFD